MQELSADPGCAEFKAGGGLSGGADRPKPRRYIAMTAQCLHPRCCTSPTLADVMLEHQSGSYFTRVAAR